MAAISSCTLVSWPPFFSLVYHSTSLFFCHRPVVTFVECLQRECCGMDGERVVGARLSDMKQVAPGSGIA